MKNGKGLSINWVFYNTNKFASSKPACNNISNILYGTYKETVDKLAASVAEELKRKFKWNSKKVEKSNLNDTQNCQMAF